MNNNVNYLRVYDEKLELLYETKVNSNKKKSGKIDRLLKRSKLFLSVDNIACYRIEPVIR